MARFAFAVQLLRLRIAGPRQACPYCGSRFRHLLQRKKLLLDINRCDFCGLMYRWPIGSAEQLRAYYNRVYPKNTAVRRDMDSGELDAHIKSNFIGSRYDHTATLRLIEHFRGKAPGGRFLDFGAGWGVIAFQAQRQGYEVLGYDINPVYATFARQRLGIEMLTERDQLLDLSPSTFDVIFSYHVLEHLPDPRETLDMLVPLLKPDGVLILFVPNAGGDAGVLNLAPLLGEHHILAFTHRFFLENLPKHGLVPCVVSSPYCFEPDQPGYFETVGCRGEELLAVARKRPTHAGG